MDVSVFKALGPIMIGPSSSHTAGAAKIARVARLIANGEFDHVAFGLCGSFAHTYKGHGTDRALVAGALGLYEDDERLADSFELARQAGLNWEFYHAELDDVHENTVVITFSMKNGERQEIIGSSLGGGQIMINSINGFKTDITAQLSTLVISQHDRRGVISKVSKILADSGINIGTMKVSRSARGEVAFCIIESDSHIPEELAEQIKNIDEIISVRAINIGEKEEG